MNARLLQCLLAILMMCCGGIPKAALAQPAGAEDLAAEYRDWLDHGRTPARFVELVRTRSPGWTVVDALAAAATTDIQVRPGGRLMFVAHDRSVLLVAVGEAPLARAGARVIGAHIDTPSPRVDMAPLAGSGGAAAASVMAQPYGGMRRHHWLHRPLAMVGRVIKAGGAEVDIALGLEGQDDFAFFVSEARGSDQMVVTLSSGAAGSQTPAEAPAGAQPTHHHGADATLLGELGRRYGLEAKDLEAAEVYLVPRMRAREVGVDRSLIGAHGQDDRANSYVAWRAIMDLGTTPRVTAMVWLVDREEAGSHHVAGARSRFLELVYTYLLRGQGAAMGESTLARALAATVAISADTPPALNPNWPEVHERQHAPLLGDGPALFPFTGRGGKRGGSAAHAPLTRSVLAAFARVGAPLQPGELGKVDEGGGGTIAKFLAQRGIDVVDVGVPVVSMHSPFELSAKIDLWNGYRGFRAWLLD